MLAKLQNSWTNIRTSLWFVPALLALLALLVSSVLIEADVILAARSSRLIPWIFSGTADAARALLATIAGSLVTVISVAFSVTIVAIQQASSQFTPRVLRTFTSDRGNQIVLGTYTATFIYALLVMRTIRSSTDTTDQFVPALSVTTAIGLALVCLGMLIYFIHHISQALQVAVIIDHVHNELSKVLDKLYPATIGQAITDPTPTAKLIQGLGRVGEQRYLRSADAGFLRRIDAQHLFEASDGAIDWLWVRPCIGDYVPRGSVLAEFAPNGTITDDQLEQLCNTFVLDTERTIDQDPFFGIRQLVDIALKALSPGINDPTTAEYCLSYLGNALGRLAERPFPANERTGPNGETRYIFSQPAWEDFVDAAFAQIRREASDDVHVTGYILQVLHELACCIPPGRRGLAIRHEVDEIRYVLDRGTFSPADTAALRRQADQVEEVLSSPVPEPAL